MIWIVSHANLVSLTPATAEHTKDGPVAQRQPVSKLAWEDGSPTRAYKGWAMDRPTTHDLSDQEIEKAVKRETAEAGRGTKPQPWGRERARISIWSWWSRSSRELLEWWAQSKEESASWRTFQVNQAVVVVPCFLRSSVYFYLCQLTYPEEQLLFPGLLLTGQTTCLGLTMHCFTEFSQRWMGDTYHCFHFTDAEAVSEISLHSRARSGLGSLWLYRQSS